MLSCDYNGSAEPAEVEREEAPSHHGVGPPRRPLAPILLRMLEFVMGALFIYLGAAKLLGSPAAVRLFHNIGWGQWFRYVTGVIELTGGLLLIVPWLAGASALLLMTVMVVATGIELFVLHRPPVAATACLSAHGIIAWNRRAQTRRLLAHRSQRSAPPVPVA